MTRTSLAALAVIAVLCGPAYGQRGFGGGIGAGSTPEGDILRGEGFFLQGAGLYNYYSAQAEAINVDTMMRLNEYIYESIKIDNAEKAQLRAQRQAKRLANFTAIHDRIANNPNLYDMMKGDALNALFEELAGPKFGGSTYRLNSYKLDAGLVKKTPFFHGPLRATFAMSRLNSWPIALRGAEFEPERKKYQRLLDTVLELQVDRKTTRDALLELGGSVQTLSARLDQVIPPENDTLYKEAKVFIKELANSQELMKHQDVELIMGEIDRYSGTTVYDLVEFMRSHKLRFGAPLIGQESKAYPKLYAAFREQLDELKVADNRDGKVPDGKAINPDKDPIQ